MFNYNAGEPKAALDSNLGVVNNTYFIGKRLGCHEQHHNLCMQVCQLLYSSPLSLRIMLGWKHREKTGTFE